jgi:hypothetical protein
MLASAVKSTPAAATAVDLAGMVINGTSGRANCERRLVSPRRFWKRGMVISHDNIERREAQETFLIGLRTRRASSGFETTKQSSHESNQ